MRRERSKTSGGRREETAVQPSGEELPPRAPHRFRNVFFLCYPTNLMAHFTAQIPPRNPFHTP